MLGGHKTDSFFVNEVTMDILYKVIRSDRKTIALQMMPDGALIVRCPQKMPDAQIRKFVGSKVAWIQKHLQDKQQLPKFTAQQLQAMGEEAAQAVSARASYFAPVLGVTYKRITIRTQRTRWGSCSGEGNLNFNRLLSLMPPAVLDYVVVHELCHLKEMNHSTKFWALVESILPDYRQCKKWLKENGNNLMARLP